MAGMEKNCKWTFAKQYGGYDQGPNEAMAQNFKKTPFASLIRESIQNSLDAVYDPLKPVRVVVSFKKIKRLYFQNFFDIKEHIKGCIDYYKGNNKAKQLYEPMLDMFNVSPYDDEIEFIRVSDYNTKGMDYKKGDTTSPFYAFVRSAGVSSKDDCAAGGSFGFGKSAYFLISPINTIIVSTMTNSGKHFFEGIASLCTHTINGEKYVAHGYYDDNNGEPTYDSEAIPKAFRREEPGTDFNIIGFKHKTIGDERDEMKLAVLRNFWLAIYDKKLEVVIDGDEINSENIDEQMELYFKDAKDDGVKSTSYNPRPYFDAVRFCETNKRYVKFQDFVEPIGNVILYVNKDKDASKDKVIYMRKPKMFVYSKKLQTNYGLYGVFVCCHDEGNRILRELENAAHDEWLAANYRDKKTNQVVQEGKDALESIDRFVQKCINSLFQSDDATNLTITGLEEYLYVPEDLIDGDDDAPETHFVGVPSGEYVEDGSAITTDMQDNPATPTPKENIGSVVVIQQAGVTTDEDGNSTVFKGDRKPRKERNSNPFSDGGSSSKHTSGGKNDGGDENGDSGTGTYNDDEHAVKGLSKFVFNVTFRVIAVKNNDGSLVHNIIIHSDYDADNAEIELLLGGEQTDEKPEIVSSNMGVIKENSITSLSICQGKNTLQVQFDDNMRHAVKLKAYGYK